MYPGKLNASLFTHFLRDFMKYRRRPMFLVLDSLPAPKAKSVEKYVESLKGKLEFYFLPTYAPDTNPDEFVWSHLKQNGTSKTPLRKNESLPARVWADLAAIQSDPPLVRSFFRAASVSYASY